MVRCFTKLFIVIRTVKKFEKLKTYNLNFKNFNFINAIFHGKRSDKDIRPILVVIKIYRY